MTESDSDIIANQNSMNKGQVFHHGKDSCYKCKICGEHFYIEDQAKRCNHDYAIAKAMLK